MITYTITWILILTLCDTFPCHQKVYTGFRTQEACRVTGAKLAKAGAARTFDCLPADHTSHQGH